MGLTIEEIELLKDKVENLEKKLVEAKEDIKHLEYFADKRQSVSEEILSVLRPIAHNTKKLQEALLEDALFMHDLHSDHFSFNECSHKVCESHRAILKVSEEEEEGWRISKPLVNVPITDPSTRECQCTRGVKGRDPCMNCILSGHVFTHEPTCTTLGCIDGFILIEEE